MNGRKLEIIYGGIMWFPEQHKEALQQSAFDTVNPNNDLYPLDHMRLIKGYIAHCTQPDIITKCYI